MYETIRRAAFASVARGCGFAGLATVTAMMGFAGEPANALKFGGLSALLVAVILILKAWRAPAHPYKDTEVWLLLPVSDRPEERYAQRLVAAARVEALYRFAFLCAMLAAILLGSGVIAAVLARA